MKKYLKYILLIVTIFLIVSMSRSTVKMLGKGKTIDDARKNVENLEKEQAGLLKLKEKVDSDQFVEKEARDKLGLTKPGDTVVVLPPDDVLRKFAPLDEKVSFVEEQPIYKRWIKLFF